MKIHIVDKNSGEFLSTIETPLIPSVGDAVIVKSPKSHGLRVVKEYVVRQRRFFVKNDIENLRTVDGWTKTERGTVNTVALIVQPSEEFALEMQSIERASG